MENTINQQYRKNVIFNVVLNIVCIVLALLIGIKNDNGGAGFGYVFIWLFISGIVSLIHIVVTIVCFRKEAIKYIVYFILTILMIGVNIWEMSGVLYLDIFGVLLCK